LLDGKAVQEKFIQREPVDAAKPSPRLTVEEARSALVEFLNRSARRGLRCLRIIHGKGLRSKNREPVLKPKLGAWLIHRDEVLAFCQARGADGGGGAVVVLLKGGGLRDEG